MAKHVATIRAAITCRSVLARDGIGPVPDFSTDRSLSRASALLQKAFLIKP